ncbi:hypothetical protein [Pectobacterium versatile]|uniref:hypothetical protein n=1 Tax=Pectobacterium versatile TaxID=2488639 RepID=UPI001CF2FB65|nr:hypothetical protein [Pectobacterium versatile]MCA6926595.1 hypothetical protein [Pectobacterium versatile]
MNNISVSNGSTSRTLSPMLFNNCGVLGRNQTMTTTHLTQTDKALLKSITLGAVALKNELINKRKAKSVAKNPDRKLRTYKETPNTLIGLFGRLVSYENMPSGMEGYFMGAVTQHTTNSRHNAYVVFSLMKSLPIISTGAVYVTLNQRRVDTERIGVQYAKELANACCNVIKVFTFYAEIISRYIRELEQTNYLESEQFDFAEDSQGYELDRLTRAPITKEQLSQNLFKAGLSFDEVQRHTAGHMIESSTSRYRISNGGRIILMGKPDYK